MKLSIIILFTFDKEALYVKNILKWIINNQSFESFDVIVVSNGNKVYFDSLSKEFNSTKFIKFVYNEKNLGYGQGNHRGILESNSKYFLILNPDVELFKGNLEIMFSHMEAHSDIGVLAPQLIYEDGRVQDVYRRFPSISDLIIKRTFLKQIPFFKNRVLKYLMHDKNPEFLENVDWVVGACILVRRKMYDDIGGFDKRFFRFMEDTDLCRRMWDKGHRVVYLPKAKATHYHESETSGGIMDVFKEKTVRIHIVSAIKYFWKYKFKKTPKHS